MELMTLERRFYYDNTNGRVLFDSGEIMDTNLQIKQMTVDEEISLHPMLNEYDREKISYLSFEYGHFPEDSFDGLLSLEVDLITSELIFNKMVYDPDTDLPIETKLENRILELEIENLELYETVANLYESMLGG